MTGCEAQLYFAYGSNMDEQHMAACCPASRYIDCACLEGHRLAFTRRSIVTGTGVADVVPSRDGRVWGVVYELDDRDLEALDRKEGEGWAYARGRTRVRLAADGSVRGVTIYTVLEKEREEVPPSREYLERLIAAATSYGLPSDYVAMLKATG